MERWYRLDHAGKLFPAVTSEDNTSTYRISVILTELVQEEQLQKAVDIIINRFPTMAVKINNGVYWDYFSENKERLMIQSEKNYPCFSINHNENNGHMIPVLYYKRKISVEAFHALTDGTGILEFVKTLLYQYLLLVGKTIDSLPFLIIVGILLMGIIMSAKRIYFREFIEFIIALMILSQLPIHLYIIFGVSNIIWPTILAEARY